VPPSLLPSAQSSPENSVLLVEDYDALAVAIGSALKKFAPEHMAQIARSLVEAEGLAAETEPSLFVLDFDPPHAGDIAFLSKLKGLYPNARVLVLVAANMREIGSEIGSTGALHFIEKPFELAGFGASVQALLGPWAATASDKVRGTLRDLCLMDVLQLKCSTGATGLVEVQAPGGRVGEIHFRDGHICHAAAQNSSGSPALETMLRWQSANFAEAELPLEGPKTVSRPWKIVLLDALRKVREIEELTELLEPKKPKPVRKKAKPAKKVVVIDDTEMLLIFVEDILTSESQDLDIITASAGGEGVSRVEKHLPDLVLLDYSLPDINGDEVCQRLLANEKTARIPIVMMSGHVLEMNEAAARYENIVATIAKPFLSQSLVDLVQKTLAEGKVRVLPSPPALQASETPSSALSAGPVAGSAAPRPPIPPPLEIAAGPARISVAPPATSPLSVSENEVVLGFPLEVTSMQLTPLLKIGSLRAKPSSLAVSLRVRSGLVREPRPLEIGFELGAVKLDERGRIDTMRLVPTRRSLDPPAPTRRSFEVGAIEDLPANARNRVQLTSTIAAPMTMQLLAHFHLLAVEMAPNLEIGALLVKAHAGSVRVTLDRQTSAPEANAATFDYSSVKLDVSARIVELSLIPLD
jgi:two-component system cell cycle response regulator DivK